MAMWRVLGLSLVVAGLLPSCGGGGGASSGNQGGGNADTTPPVVLSTNPANLATGVPLNATLSASFSEGITSASPATAFTLAQAGTAVPGTVSFAGGTASFAPTARLGASLAYTASLSPGIKDLAGNPLASPTTWSFITSDCNAITLVRQFSPSLGTATNAMFKALATDGTTIYLWTQTDFLVSSGTLFKLDPATGNLLSSSVLPLVASNATTPTYGIQFVADIAWHAGALWASGTYLAPGGALTQGVFRINLATGLAETPLPAAAGLAGETTILQGLASDGTSLYVAMDRMTGTPLSTQHLIVKFNPATSAQVPLAPALLSTVGQVIRLDCGGGYLWVYSGQSFQQVNPASGSTLVTFCKADGGPNLLYLSGNIWSIKDSVLMVYSLP